MNTRSVQFEFPDMRPHERLWELVIYIAKISEGDKKFGKVKLAKILYFADFESYKRYGKPITGSRYIRWDLGPVPDDYNGLLDEMIARRDIAIRMEQHPHSEHTWMRVMALREANLAHFSGTDIALVRDIIEWLKGKSAKTISQLSHRMAWENAARNEPIPYQASLLSDEPINQDDLDTIQELAAIYGSQPSD